MTMVSLIARRREYPVADQFQEYVLPRSRGQCILAVATPFIVIGGILSGVYSNGLRELQWFTAILCMFMRSLPFSRVKDMLFRTTCIIECNPIGCGHGNGFCLVATLSGVPKLLTAFLFEYTDNKYRCC